MRSTLLHKNTTFFSYLVMWSKLCLEELRFEKSERIDCTLFERNVIITALCNTMLQWCSTAVHRVSWTLKEDKSGLATTSTSDSICQNGAVGFKRYKSCPTMLLGKRHWNSVASSLAQNGRNKWSFTRYGTDLGIRRRRDYLWTGPVLDAMQFGDSPFSRTFYDDGTPYWIGW